eukprot:scaffold12007_cov42-Cyclotella_meneghiniana.AAC.7
MSGAHATPIGNLRVGVQSDVIVAHVEVQGRGEGVPVLYPRYLRCHRKGLQILKEDLIRPSCLPRSLILVRCQNLTSHLGSMF